MTSAHVFWLAFGAGSVISLLDYASLRSIPKIERPATFTDPPYLAKFFGHPVVGGFLAAVLNQQGDGLSPLMVLIVGAAAPSIWQALVRAGPGMVGALLGGFSGSGTKEGQ